MTSPSFTASRSSGAAATRLPKRAGVGLKPEHFRDILELQPDMGFFEVHAENYMVEGGPFHHYLGRIRERYALSLHGVALSIGGVAALDLKHLNTLAALLERYQPQSFSEHLAWSSHSGAFLNDLLPVPYTAATLQRVCEHIDQTQSHLKRRMLLENPASYVEFRESSMDEAEFLTQVVRRTGCGLLLDVNNAFVSSVNHGHDAYDYIASLPLVHVGEIHLAGFAQQQDSLGQPLLIDSHGSPVAQAVWDLYTYTLQLTGAAPTLIERDNDVPAWPVLFAEAKLAEQQLRALAHTAEQATAELCLEPKP
jgi:uncharacterized protein (UPF0276 family)